MVLMKVPPSALISSLNNALSGWTGNSGAAGRFCQVGARLWVGGWVGVGVGGGGGAEFGGGC